MISLLFAFASKGQWNSNDEIAINFIKTYGVLYKI